MAGCFIIEVNAYCNFLAILAISVGNTELTGNHLIYHGIGTKQNPSTLAENLNPYCLYTNGRGAGKLERSLTCREIMV